MKTLLLAAAILIGCVMPSNAKPLHLIPIGPAFACQSVAHAPKCHVVNVQGYEIATTLTIPNSFVPNTTILSASVNQNFSTIQSWANGNVDSSNVGSSGINPSVVKCTGTATCTFGSPQTYIFNPNNTGVVPLNITNAVSPTVDYLDITANGGAAGGVVKVDKNGSTTITAQATASPVLTVVGAPTPATDYVDVTSSSGSAGNVANINSSGNMSTQGVIFAAPTATPTASAVWAQNDNAVISGLTFNVPTSSTNGYRFKVNRVDRVVISAAGYITATVFNVNNVNLVGMLTSGGTNGGTGSEAQAQQVTKVDASGCNNATICTSTTFSAIAPPNEVGCGISNGSAQEVMAFMAGVSGSGSYTVYWYNLSGGTIGAQTYVADIVCGGY